MGASSHGFWKNISRAGGSAGILGGFRGSFPSSGRKDSPGRGFGGEGFCGWGLMLGA